jgi:propanediol dehydratase small subunit
VEPDSRKDYPLGSMSPELVSTPGGTPLADVTLAALKEGRLDPLELRATPETLRRQSEIARGAGREALAANLARAAELAAVPDEILLDVYTALRPHRSTGPELDAWAERIESDYGASATAEFIREARAAYAERGFLTDERDAAV